MTSTPPGTQVTIQGLMSKPLLNGKRATVLGPQHSKDAADGYSRGRVPVLLEDGETLLLKPEALMVAEAGTSAVSYDALCESAVVSFRGHNLPQAVATLKRAIAMEPDTFTAYFQLGQCYEVYEGEPGASELAAINFLQAAKLTAPESSSPDYHGWTNAFVRAANLLATLPSAPKPPWWTPVGIKQRVGLVLASPQGFLPDSDLVVPAWQLTGHAFEMENELEEAAKAYEKAAGYEMEAAKCEALMGRAAELRWRTSLPAEKKPPKKNDDDGWTLV